MAISKVVLFQLPMVNTRRYMGNGSAKTLFQRKFGTYEISRTLIKRSYYMIFHFKREIQLMIQIAPTLAQIDYIHIKHGSIKWIVFYGWMEIGITDGG